MAAAERLFALELLVDWVRLDGPAPRAPGPAVAFRLLDFPPLLVRPPGPPPRRGAIAFGRGKACVFRLRPAALRRPLLRAALLWPGPGPEASPEPRADPEASREASPEPWADPEASREASPEPGPAAPRLLGACCLPLARGAQGQSATLVLRDPAGRRVGELALFYRLTELGARRPASAPPRSPARAPDPDPDRAGLASGSPDPPDSRAASPPGEDRADPDLEANTFCPPPLYYTHTAQEKTPPARGTVSIEPQRTAREELAGLSPPASPSPPERTRSATRDCPPVRVIPPRDQDGGAVGQTECPPPADQSTINTIRQLPLLNALLIELSLLYNQPVASPTHVHPHLAWLYRTEEKKASESSSKSTWQSEPKKDELCVEACPKSVSLQCEKNQAENLKKGKYFEKSSGSPPKRVTKGRLLYGLTKTLRLRLKQTNPDMLVEHERREQYRKMQAQPLGPKFRVPSSKVPNFAEGSQKPCQLHRDKYIDPDASFSENSDTSGQISGFIDEPSSTKETKLKCATECDGNGTSNAFLKGIVSPADSVIPERLSHTNVSEGKLERKAPCPCVCRQDAVDRTVHPEVDGGQAKATDNDILTVGRSESRPSKNSWYESSELKYSDDFTSPCYSEDFYTPDDTSRSFEAPDSPGAGSPDSRVPRRKSGSDRSLVLSPPFSAGSPVLSQKRSHVSKTRDKALEEASSSSASSLSSHWTEEKGNKIDQNSTHNSKATERGHNCHDKHKSGTGRKCSEKSQSPQTSQVSSYLPSNLSELERKVLESSASDHLEDDDDIGSLRISKQCKDICELVINKLPGYTV